MGNLVKDFESILEKFEDKNAVVYYSEENKSFQNITYKDAKRDYESLYKNVLENITEEHCCVTLLMTHNPYIPALVMR